MMRGSSTTTLDRVRPDCGSDQCSPSTSRLATSLSLAHDELLQDNESYIALLRNATVVRGPGAYISSGLSILKSIRNVHSPFSAVLLKKCWTPDN
jgi:hypothetical protein